MVTNNYYQSLKFFCSNNAEKFEFVEFKRTKLNRVSLLIANIICRFYTIVVMTKFNKLFFTEK